MKKIKINELNQSLVETLKQDIYNLRRKLNESEKELFQQMDRNTKLKNRHEEIRGFVRELYGYSDLDFWRNFEKWLNKKNEADKNLKT